MAYFTQDFLDFMSDLTANNNRDWFNQNKKRYIAHVKEPFEKFVTALINKLSLTEPALEPLSYKECVFRIYRDTRFSKDKTPYKTHVSAAIGEGGRKEMTIPGLYVQLSAEDVRIYSGCYQLDKNRLLQVREHIIANLDDFRTIISQDDFVQHYGEIRGDKNKRLTGNVKIHAEKEPLLFNKQFYYYSQFPADLAVQEDLLEEIAERYNLSRPIGDFFRQALR